MSIRSHAVNALVSRNGRILFGGFVGLPSLLSVEGFARAGYDFVVLDLQHGTFSYEFALNAIQLLDVLGVESLNDVAVAEYAEDPGKSVPGAGCRAR